MYVYKEDGNFIQVDDNGDESPLRLEKEWVICYDCRGEGYTLGDGMRGHAYSMEEFHEDFNEDERRGYFNGAYDVPCRTCRRTGKLHEVNMEKLHLEQPEVAKAIDNYYQELADDAATYRMEMGYY